eukprot:TRINITY_DN60210_c0_g3_i1.p1 TRINITY_DN60210_c0_g3~~TRINITY_DN60210_c0_g3_i1.p1  ORF type:complete len:303 (+),score=51.87 TRINITY_DN60210_c0_g3_i1:127-909(+)
MKNLLVEYKDDKEELISKAISMLDSIPYGSSSVLLSPLHVCVGFNLDVLSKILDHPLLMNSLKLFEMNEWGRAVLNISAALDHQQAFTVLLNYYINHTSWETQKHVIFSALPIMFARNNPPLIVAFFSIIFADLSKFLGMQDNAGDTIAHIIVRSRKTHADPLRSQLMGLGFIPSNEFNQDVSVMIRMMNTILHDPKARLIQNKLGKTPLHVAVECNNLSMVIELLKDSNPTEREMKCRMDGYTAFEIAYNERIRKTLKS